MSCKLNKNLIISDCKTIPLGGLTGRMWLGNFSEFKESAITLGTDGEITAIVPDAGVILLFRIEMAPGSLIATSPTTRNDGGISGLVHTVTGIIADNSMDMKNSLVSLINFNKAICIIETNDFANGGGGDSNKPGYLLYGYQVGMIATLDNPIADKTKGGAITITLTSDGLEMNLPTNVDMTTAEIVTLESVPA